MPSPQARRLDLSLDLIARAHATPVPDDPSALEVLSDAELRPGLEAITAGREGHDIWVFAYGSLMWRPEFPVAESRIGTVRGFHRRFCLLQRRFRGTPERPGFVLALDRGGLCRGVVFRLPGMEIREALMPVWRREMRGRGQPRQGAPRRPPRGCRDRRKNRGRLRACRPQRRVPVPDRGGLRAPRHPRPASLEPSGAGGRPAQGLRAGRVRLTPRRASSR